MAFQDRIDKIINGIDNAVVIAKGTAVQRISEAMLYRIFNQGHDINNSQIGTYNEHFAVRDEKGVLRNYKELRKRKGLQTSYVDLTFTTNLVQSIFAQPEDNTKGTDAVRFKNQYGIDIMAANEKNFGKRIAAPSERERKIYIEELDNEIKKLFSGNN